MRLLRFQARSLHGYMDFDVTLSDNLTFLTGINGSGKTSVINAMASLISPDLNALQSMIFSEIRLTLTDDSGKKRTISSSQQDRAVAIRFDGVDEVFAFPKYIPGPNVPTFRAKDEEAEHFRELLATSSNHPVMKSIAALPTPMFLGLDRRARLDQIARRPSGRFQGANRNIFGPSASAGLAEAQDLAEEAYRRARFHANRIGEELQRRMILNLLTFSAEDYLVLSHPTEEDRQDINRAIRDVQEFPSISQLPADEIKRRVEPFLMQLQQTIEKIPFGARFQDDVKSGNSPEYMNDLLSWSANRNQLKKIKVISDYVSNYNARRIASMRGFEKYKELVDSFITDSGKSLHVTEAGDIKIGIAGVKDPQPLSSLSSGETQIFVILTNLAFNPLAQKANVFIIDEPELSLHVRWQEIFVESVISANDKVQFILATHSPSVILNRIDDCVDVVARSKGVRRGSI